MVEVSLSGETYASVRRSFFHEIGSQTAWRCTAPQPVFTRYKLLEIERHGYGPLKPCSRLWGAHEQGFTSDALWCGRPGMRPMLGFRLDAPSLPPDVAHPALRMRGPCAACHDSAPPLPCFAQYGTHTAGALGGKKHIFVAWTSAALSSGKALRAIACQAFWHLRWAVFPKDRGKLVCPPS